MPAIGEFISLQDLPVTPDVALVTNEMETAIVREYTFDEILLSRQFHPEILGRFAWLTSEEIHRELDGYEKFLVEVANGDYSLVIGYSGSDRQPLKGPTILYAVPSGSC